MADDRWRGSAVTPNVVLTAEVKHDIVLVHRAKKVGFFQDEKRSIEKSVGHDIQQPIDREICLKWGFSHQLRSQPYVNFLQSGCTATPRCHFSVSSGEVKTNHHE